MACDSLEQNQRNFPQSELAAASLVVYFRHTRPAASQPYASQINTASMNNNLLLNL
jgi:hypothetical protein